MQRDGGRFTPGASIATAALPTKYGELEILAVRLGDAGTEHAVLVKGTLAGVDVVPVYVHLECLLGHALAAAHCKCRERLEVDLQRLAASAGGIVLYLRHGQDTRDLGDALGEHDSFAPLSRGAADLASSILRTLGVDRFRFA